MSHTAHCKYCANINTSGQIKSKKLKRNFPAKSQVCCKSHNLVYCLTCTICDLQYVGQTKRTFHERLYEHFRDIQNKDLTKPLWRHFLVTLLTPHGSRFISWRSLPNPAILVQPKKCVSNLNATRFSDAGKASPMASMRWTNSLGAPLLSAILHFFNPMNLVGLVRGVQTLSHRSNIPWWWLTFPQTMPPHPPFEFWYPSYQSSDYQGSAVTLPHPSSWGGNALGVPKPLCRRTGISLVNQKIRQNLGGLVDNIAHFRHTSKMTLQYTVVMTQQCIVRVRHDYVCSYLTSTYHTRYCSSQRWTHHDHSAVLHIYTSKSSSNWLVNKDWCGNRGKLLRKWPQTGIFAYFGAQSGTKIGPLRPTFSTHIKVLALSMWSNTDVKSVKTFWENYQRPDFLLILGKMVPKLGLWGPYSTHWWKYLQWTWEAIMMWNQWKLFVKVT